MNMVNWMKEHKKAIGIIVVILCTAGLMASIYTAEFSVKASRKDTIADAIREQNFTPQTKVEVMAQKETEDYLVVLYKQADFEDCGGVALLEKGWFGNYRLYKSNTFMTPLYGAAAMSVADENYFFTYSMTNLPNVDTYRVYKDVREINELIYEGKALEAPFVEMIKTEESYVPFVGTIRYYDKDGQEIYQDELADSVNVADTAAGGNFSTADRGAAYFFMVIVFLIGEAAIYMLVRKTKKEA